LPVRPAPGIRTNIGHSTGGQYVNEQHSQGKESIDLYDATLIQLGCMLLLKFLIIQM
jgi:hypothetical protein